MHARATIRIAAWGAAVVLAASAPAHAQRFTAVGREAVTAIPGLEIVTLRDAVLNVCYTLFMLEPTLQPSPVTIPDSRSLQELADERDRRLAALLAEHERQQYAPVPGFVPNSLRYAWEGTRVQGEFDRALRDKELNRLEEQLARLAAAPRLTVTGPAPCAPAAAAKR